MCWGRICHLGLTIRFQYAHGNMSWKTREHLSRTGTYPLEEPGCRPVNTTPKGTITQKANLRRFVWLPGKPEKLKTILELGRHQFTIGCKELKQRLERRKTTQSNNAD